MAGDAHTAAIFRWLNAIAADPAQSSAAFECAYTISQRINRETKTAWPGRDVVVADMGLTGDDATRIRHVGRCLKSLTDGGYLLPRRRKQSSTVYRLSLQRTPLSFEREETGNDLGGGEEPRKDSIVFSSEPERTPVSPSKDTSVPIKGHQCPTEPLNEPLNEPRERGRARARRFPDDWKLSDEDHDFALSEGVQDIDGMAAAFADYYRGEGIARANWSAVWRNWVRREPQFSGGKGITSAVARSLAKINQTPDPQKLSDEAWEQIIARFASTGQWTRYVDLCGNAPPSPTCRAPRHLLVKYGLAEAAA